MKDLFSKTSTYVLGGAIILLVVVVLAVFYFQGNRKNTVRQIYVTPGTVPSDTIVGDLPKEKADSIHLENLTNSTR
ncbi:hypothetical protein GCM10027275_19270 [Rhabdobacter roseus]|uniref:Uncharacterized protein n=1 Tax=Rhabdobacter roseus TaxID=1655419 RepID=A0A840TRJ9_9BACT|nr:hypothetical protein [Rhabdobacter roseus]MBB5283853.1 hypothetical protein [Rhabdobacter roseus]